MSELERKPTLYDADQHDFDGLRTRVIALAAQGKSAWYIAKATGERWEKIRKMVLDEYAKETAYREDLKMEHVFTVKWVLNEIRDRLAEAGPDGKKKWDRQNYELLLKWLDHNAKLHGFYAPTEHNVQVQIEDVTDEELIRQIQVADPKFAQLISTLAPKALPERVEDAEVVISDTTDNERPAETEARPDQR